MMVPKFSVVDKNGGDSNRAKDLVNIIFGMFLKELFIYKFPVDSLTPFFPCYHQIIYYNREIKVDALFYPHLGENVLFFIS